MGDLENLQGRLTNEEATLSGTRDQIEAARRHIESLRQQIEDVKGQIQQTETHITKLETYTTTIEKRMALLREYIELVEAGEELLEPLETESAAQPAVEADEDETVDLDFVQQTAEPDAGPEEPQGPISFETLDEENFTHEVLPRTSTFGEELLLVLAHHRKPVANKDVTKLFRRLDYAPKTSPTSKNVSSQVEADRHLYEAASGKVSLTREGRDGALRLLQRLQ
jgi:TolA-binding protein